MITEHVVLLNYPESDWYTDLVKFTFIGIVSSADLQSALEYFMEEIHAENYDTLQDYTEAVCNMVARMFNGTWCYIPQACSIDIIYN